MANTEIKQALKAFNAAEKSFSAALVKQFGREAGIARYMPHRYNLETEAAAAHWDATRDAYQTAWHRMLVAA